MGLYWQIRIDEESVLLTVFCGIHVFHLGKTVDRIYYNRISWRVVVMISGRGMQNMSDVNLQEDVVY